MGRPSSNAAAIATALGVCVALLVAHSHAQVSSSSTGVDSSSSSSSTGSTATQNVTVIVPRSPPLANETIKFCGQTNDIAGGALSKYDNTTICVVVGGVAVIRFYPNVDEFSLTQMIFTNSSVNVTSPFDNVDLWFQIEFGDMVSPYKYFHGQVAPYKTADYIVPFWTLIITLKDGYVQSMEWDDGCLGCSGDMCVEGNDCCVNVYDVGCKSSGATADCNPKFFISWYGTDRDGVYLTSAGARYSRFRQYSASSAFNNAYQAADDSFSATAGDYTFTPTCGQSGVTCGTTP